jgi:hypothetical protein
VARQPYPVSRRGDVFIYLAQVRHETAISGDFDALSRSKWRVCNTPF